MKVSQKQAVYVAILNVLAESGITTEDGMDVAPLMTKERRAIVNAILIAGFGRGEIELSRGYDEKEMKSYVSGLQSNWIRKDTRLNGGSKYEAKNPGSRAGSGDAQLTAMKALLATLTDPTERSEVQAYIDARTAELTKVNAPVIDFTKLPPELAAKFKK